jgi:capsid protein
VSAERRGEMSIVIPPAPHRNTGGVPTYGPNRNPHNRSVYKWVVVDSTGKPVAYTVTEHTARQFSEQLRARGYIEVV